MFFFIGVTMALIQGGYARKIKPGHHVKAVRMVNLLLFVAQKPYKYTTTDTPSLTNCVFFLL